MQVVDVHAIDGRVVADLVGFAVGDAPFDAAAGEPESEGVGIVVAAGLLGLLRDRQAAEFAAPDHEGVFQKPALGKIGEQAGQRLVGLSGELFVVSLDIVVPVPRELIVHAA